MNILITGANGFLGSWLCELALKNADAHVFAAVRKGANIDKISNLRSLKLLDFDYSTEASIIKSLKLLKSTAGEMDLVIHNAGLTKSISSEQFFETNVGITSKLVKSLVEAKTFSKIGKICYVSSLAAIGPVGFNKPLSAYGESKLASEKIIRDSGLDYMIFRPTGIYGPGDKEFLPLFKSVKKGFYPCAAPISQKVTLIHGHDVAQNIIALSKSDITNKIIHLEDGNIYSHRMLKDQISTLLGRKAWLIQIPNWLTRFALKVDFYLGKIFQYEPILTIEKYNEISKDWNHDFTSERKEIPLEIKYDLSKGFASTLEYYQSQKLL